MKSIVPPFFRQFCQLILPCLLFAAASTLHAAIDVTIGTSATTGGSFVKGTWTPTSSPSRIHVNDLIAALDLGNVTINTAGIGLQNGDVVIAATLPLDNLASPLGQRLTLNAQRSILINAAISQSVKGGDDDPDAMNLLLNADLAGTSTGIVAFSANVDSAGGNISASGAGLTMAALTTIDTRGGSLAATLAGAFTISGNAINTSGGPAPRSGPSTSPQATERGRTPRCTRSGSSQPFRQQHEGNGRPGGARPMSTSGNLGQKCCPPHWSVSFTPCTATLFGNPGHSRPLSRLSNLGSLLTVHLTISSFRGHLSTETLCTGPDVRQLGQFTPLTRESREPCCCVGQGFVTNNTAEAWLTPPRWRALLGATCSPRQA